MKDIAFVRKGLPLLKGVGFELKSNEHWIILGPNGSGKSTLAAIICGYIWPSSGTVRIFGEEFGKTNIHELRTKIGIFQPSAKLGLDHHHPRISALEVILTGSDAAWACYHNYPAPIVKKAKELYESCFAKAGSYPIDRRFQWLSSGEKHKVLLMRAFMADIQLLILDEPYSCLDIPSRLSLEKLLTQKIFPRSSGQSGSRLGTNGRQIATITILHRLEEISPFSTHVLLLRSGTVLKAGRLGDVLNSRNLSVLYEIPLEVGFKNGRYFCVPNKKSGDLSLYHVS